MKYSFEEIESLASKLRQRLRRGLFTTYATMEEAASCLEILQNEIEQLEQKVTMSDERYRFVLQQWMAERLISDNLHADLLAFIRTHNASNDSKILQTEYMKEYQESRRNGTIVF